LEAIENADASAARFEYAYDEHEADANGDADEDAEKNGCESFYEVVSKHDASASVLPLLPLSEKPTDRLRV
jgi:hypothetical protein